MDKKPNQSIGCTVTKCEYHCGNKQYCSLDRVQIGTHEDDPTMKKCTDCESFEAKNYQ